MTRRGTLALALLLATLAIFSTVHFSLFKDFSLNASAVESTANLGVYRDLACTRRVYSINWGNLTPGDIKEFSLFVRNEGTSSCVLVQSAANWSPSGGWKYLNFFWNCTNSRIDSGKIIRVSEYLKVSPFIRGISNFSFDIVFSAQEPKFGDLGGGLPPQFFKFDGVINYMDMVLLLRCYQGDAPPEAMYFADLGGMANGVPTFFAFDRTVNWVDWALFAQCYKGLGP